MSGSAFKDGKASGGRDGQRGSRGGRRGDGRDCGSPLSSASTAPTLDGASDVSSPGDRGKTSPSSTTPKAGESRADRFAAAFESIAERPKGKGRARREPRDHGEGGASPTLRAGNPGEGGDTPNSSKPAAVIHKQIVSIVEKNSALQLADFDFRVRQHFHAVYGQGGEERLAAAASFIRTATMSKERESVRSWPAFIVALLRRFEQECPYQAEEKAQAPATPPTAPPTAPPKVPPNVPPTAPPAAPPVL